jgi:AcrR family transcriptional regulator
LPPWLADIKVKRNTREHILQTSLVLFNALGEPRVTTNQIALEADISPGNLYYYFRSKHDIVLELFKRFVTQFEPLLDIPDDTSLEAEDLWFQLHLSFELKGHFRFLYRNLQDLNLQIPDLGKAFLGLLNRERRAMSNIIQNLQMQKKLSITPTETFLLLNNLMLGLTYWISYADLYDAEAQLDGTVQAAAIAGVLQLLIPYLQAQDKRHFSMLVQSYIK